MTLITVTSIGYGEIHPLDESGRIFTSFLILGGVGNAAYGFGMTAQFFAEGGWYAFRRRVLMQKRLENVRDHTIVCGFGRLGSAIVDGLIEAHHPVVVVENEKPGCWSFRRNIPSCFMWSATRWRTPL
jgi:voltage-gated potassium channel